MDILGDKEARAAGICEMFMKFNQLSRGVDTLLVRVHACDWNVQLQIRSHQDTATLISFPDALPPTVLFSSLVFLVLSPDAMRIACPTPLVRGTSKTPSFHIAHVMHGPHKSDLVFVEKDFYRILYRRNLDSFRTPFCFFPFVLY